MSSGAPSEIELAIVIPAYRGQFLGRALASLAGQTDRRFRVYVGDDGSAEDLAAIVDPFRARLDLHYRRFADNLGSDSLVAHWARVIGLSREKWIWLFSDDDEAEPRCVEGFYATLATHLPEVALLRFDLDLIDEAGRVYRRIRAQPAYETAEAATLALLGDRRREWRGSNHVFTRAVYDERGGIAAFPLAMFSDYAAWIEFATPRGVRTVAGPRVRWRHHVTGLSSSFGERHRTELLAAVQRYAQWLVQHASRMAPEARGLFLQRARRHVLGFVGLISPPLGGGEMRDLRASLCGVWGGALWRDEWALTVADFKGRWRGRPWLRWLVAWRHRRRSLP